MIWSRLEGALDAAMDPVVDSTLPEDRFALRMSLTVPLLAPRTESLGAAQAATEEVQSCKQP